MKKEDISGLSVWIAILGGIAVYFYFVIRPHGTIQTSYVFGATNWFVYVLFFFAAIIVGVIFNAILFELAHAAGAKAGRYEIVSINILGFMFFKDQGKTKFHMARFDGLTGETKILPKGNAKKEPNPSAFLLFGSLFYGLEIVLVLFAYLLITSVQNTNTFAVDWAYFILTIGVVGGAILFYNIVPLRLDSLNDGYRLRLVGSRKNRHAFNQMLYTEVTGQISNELEEKAFKETKDSNFSADINLNKAYVLMSEEKFGEAESIFKEIIDNKKSSNKVVATAENQIIYINMLTKPFEEVEAYCGSNVSMDKKRELASDKSLGSIRTYILIAGIVDKSHYECLRALEASRKSYSRVPDPRKPLEKALFNKALEKVIIAHPSWEELKSFIL